MVDTNCDPDVIQHVIPGNDDAIRSCRLMVNAISEAILEGQRLLSERELQRARGDRGGGRQGALARPTEARGRARRSPRPPSEAGGRRRRVTPRAPATAAADARGARRTEES